VFSSKQGKRDILLRQKRPMHQDKETCVYGKIKKRPVYAARDLFMRQKRPMHKAKKD
jgi:hypothetical protein